MVSVIGCEMLLKLQFIGDIYLKNYWRVRCFSGNDITDSGHLYLPSTVKDIIPGHNL